MTTVIVYVHGLWLNGWESVLLRRRLSLHLDCRCLSFTYPSVGAGLRENALALAAFLNRTPADKLHLVGHSLGGLVILECLGSGLPASNLPPGRVVLLGSPVQGSRAARYLAQLRFGRRILGLTGSEGLLATHERRWEGNREIGVIAGNLPLGFGRLIGRLNAPSDGTVLVEETRLSGARQHLILRTSHTGMVYSAAVARQAATFLRAGHFAP